MCVCMHVAEALFLGCVAQVHTLLKGLGEVLTC
jgi:hypothetical protein